MKVELLLKEPVHHEYIVGDNIFNILILRGYTEGFF